MASNTLLKRLLDAGMHFTEMSQATAEKLVGEFVKAGGVRRKDAERTVQHLVDRGRSATEHLVGTVQAEVTTQLGRFAGRLDELEHRLEEIAVKLGITRPEPPAPAAQADAAPAAAEPKKPAEPAAKKPAKKTPAKQTGAGKSASKKSSATKSGSKQPGAKRSPARTGAAAAGHEGKKPVPSSGIGKVTVGRAPGQRAAQP